MRISVNDHIVIDSRFCHGKPIFKGTRIMVSQVLELLEAGRSAKDILKCFPSLSPQAVEAALDYAASLAEGRDNVIPPIPSKD
jgi:uncharacterized protein (DUF433 family)